MRGRRLGAAMILLLAASPAAAEHVGVLALDGKDAPVPRGELARRIAAAASDATAGVLTTAAENLRAGAVPRSRLERFTQVRARADEGWRSFTNVQPDAARSRLARARGDAEELLAIAGGLELYADISLRLGAVLDHLGRDAEAGDAIRVALALDPDRVLTEREFSPDVLAAVESARAVAPPTRAVRIGGSTPGRAPVELEVDGTSRGTAPLTLELPLGNHVVIARAPGHTPRALAFALNATATTELAVDLDPDPHAAAIAAGLAAGTPDGRATATVEAALRFGEVDAIIVAATAWRRDEPALLIQRCAGIPLRCTPITEIGYRDSTGLDAAARAGLEDVSTAGATLVAPTLANDRRLEQGRGNDGRCITCKPWVWAGAGAVLIAATVITLVVTADKPTHPLIILDPGATGPPLE
jgi:hypothetical protein